MSVLSNIDKEEAAIFEIIWGGYLDSNEYLKAYGGRALMDLQEAFYNGMMAGIGLYVMDQKIKGEEDNG